MLKKIGIIAGIVLLSVAASYLLITLLIIPQFIDSSNAADSTGTVQDSVAYEEEQETPTSPVGTRDYLRNFAIYQMDDIIVNPKGTESRFLVVNFAFEYRTSDRRLPDELNNKKPIIVDQMNQYLASKFIEELSDITYRDQIREDIRTIVNYLLVEGQITRVLITQFIIQ